MTKMGHTFAAHAATGGYWRLLVATGGYWKLLAAAGIAFALQVSRFMSNMPCSQPKEKNGNDITSKEFI